MIALSLMVTLAQWLSWYGQRRKVGYRIAVERVFDLQGESALLTLRHRSCQERVMWTEWGASEPSVAVRVKVNERCSTRIIDG